MKQKKDFTAVIEEFQKRLKERKILYLTLRVLPKSQKTEISEILEDDSLKIRIKSPPEKGKANQEVCTFFSHIFPGSAISIVSGKVDRMKMIKICR